MTGSIARVTEVLHEFLRPLIRQGDCVLDCTLGNGHDAVFLAKCIGPSGHLYGFDVQAEAIEKTRRRLMTTGLPPQRYELFHESHDQISRRVTQPVSICMYNLGYLPGGDRARATRGVTTLQSLGQALDALLPTGLVSLVLYRGHPEGSAETDAVRSFASTLPAKEYHVMHWCYPNLGKNPPEVLIIQKTTP